MAPTSNPPGQARLTVDGGRLWAGGVATAVVAGLVGLVGVLICEGVFDLTMAHPPGVPVGDSFAVQYALTAALLALVATAIAHLLVLTTPRPRSFLGWIVGLGIVVGIVLPFSVDATLGGQLASAFLALVVGVCVLNLLMAVLARTVRSGPPRVPGRPPV